MKKSVFRGACTGLIAASLLLVTACQGSNPDAQGSAPAALTDAPGNATVTFWYPSFIKSYVEATVKPAFETEFPQYKLEATGFENNEAVWTNYQNAQQEKKAPDVLALYEVALQQARDSGYFQSVDQATGNRAAVNGVSTSLEDLSPSAKSFYADPQGKYFSVPMSVSAPVFYVNMNLLQQAGVVSSVEDTASIPKNWAQMSAACTAIQAKTQAKCAWWLQDSWFVENALAQADSPIVDQSNGRDGAAGKTLLNSKPVTDYMNWWQQMSAKGSYAKYGSNPGTAPQSDFAAGNLAFYGTSSGAITSTTKLGQDNGFTVRVAASPAAPGNDKPGSVIGGSSLYLSKGISDVSRDAALTFIYTLLQGGNAAKLSEQTGYLPVRQSATDLLKGQGYFDRNPNQLAPVQMLAQNPGGPNATSGIFGSYKDARPTINKAIESVIQGTTPVQQAFDRAAATMNQQIEEYNTLNSRP